VNASADQDPSILRLSMDAKATVKIGPFSRGGKNRVETAACDHDFQPQGSITPQGIFLPQFDELFLYLNTSKVTADLIVDVLEDCWQQHLSARFPQVKTLLLNQDNGPENHSRRTQFMKRMIEFAQKFQLNVRLAYYPPYHSKYNPIERTWASLEHHWNGSILDEVETVVNFAQTMTWKGKNPVVKLTHQTYDKGVKLTLSEMEQVESQIQRFCELGKWFVDIYYDSSF
jgi:hypothetical protein